MAWGKFKPTAIAVMILMCTGTAILVKVATLSRSQNITPTTRTRLPVGRVTPAVGLGERHGVVLASNGSLWSWGENANGWPVLGLGTITKQTSLRQIGSDTNWASIGVGWHHNLAIKSDGTLWGWGENLYGQLGDVGDGAGGARSRSTPVPSVSGNDWKQAAVGFSHSVALKQDGTLWAWGNNWSGQLGIGSTVQRALDAVQVGSATNWVKVRAGILETVALQSDGSLWYWGDNPEPKVPQDAAHAIREPMRVSADTNWVDAGFGAWTALAIKSDGTLWAWGRFAHELTGAREHSLDASPIRVGTDNDWQTISPLGSKYRLLMKTDGTLWEMRNSPLRVARLNLDGRHWVAYNGNGNVVSPLGVVLTDQGEVWSWGRVLGENTPDRKSLQHLSRFLQRMHLRADWGNSRPVMRSRLWRLPVSNDSDIE